MYIYNILLSYIGRKSFHNYATGGASPEDSVAMRRIDRIYHKQLVKIDGEDWVVFSISGDSFMKGSIRRLIGTFLIV